MTESKWQLKKRRTGIPGLDQISHGGLPARQATLILGQAGTGKTILTLQILAHAAEQGEGGVFVTFEESPAQVRRNTASFGWGEKLINSDKWALIDARSRIGAEVSGAFDIDGLLAAIESQISRFDRPWVVIDGLDQLLRLHPAPSVAVDQVRQINERCERNGWTLLLSGKIGEHRLSPQHLEGIEFMLPTMLVLTATVIDHRLHRRIRIAKYRGSSHVTDEVPMLVTDSGIQLPYQTPPTEAPVMAGTERISSGITRLDKLLGGGVYRSSSTLISGRPGTAKSTLAASFANACAERGERALYLSFDELESPFVRNLASVGIDLKAHIENGLIRFCARSALSGIITEHVLLLQQLVEEFEPNLIVIDPVSALLKTANSDEQRAATEHILSLVRAQGITTLMTSLTGKGDPEDEATAAQVSTIADTWIVLDYNVRGGERNRSLSIVKSRGSAHSNQQRELLLSDKGIDLADVYEYGTEVLMGTARVQKKSEEKATERRRSLEQAQRRQDLERSIEQARNEVTRLTERLELEQQDFEEIDRITRSYSETMKSRRDPERGNKSARKPDKGEEQ